MLIEATIDGKPLTNSEIKDEVNLLMLGGHDTVAIALSFCLFNLAKYPKVQQKARNEIQKLIGNDINKPVTQNDCNNLEYLELVLKETLRIYPPVPIFGRKAQEDIDISKTKKVFELNFLLINHAISFITDGKHFPKGTNLLFFQWQWQKWNRFGKILNCSFPKDFYLIINAQVPLHLYLSVEV